MAVTFVHETEVPSGDDLLVVPVFRGRRLPPDVEMPLDLRFLEAQGFDGEAGRAQALVAPDGRPLLAVGVGEAADVTADTLRQAAAAAVKAAWKATGLVTTLLAAAPESLEGETAAQAVAEGTVMAAYRFTAYKSEPDGCRLERVTVVGPGGAEVQGGLDRGGRVAAAVCFARDLANEPAGSLSPRRLAEIAGEVAAREGLQMEVLDEAGIVEQGLGGLAGVARGSTEPPRLVQLVYDPPGGQPDATVALVGKGVTFDSGGLSIKTAEGMMAMKTDMSGAAAVLATLSVLPSLGTRVRVVGILPCTENMPGGSAVKPGDVLRMRNGKTVEVLNTDAEGRLILADGLSLAAEAEPDAIVDLATLTGAQVVALGRKIAGVMGNHDGLVDQVRAASQRAGEPSWPLPLPTEYRSHIDSEVADVKNIGHPGQAGTLVAGLFLQEFVADVPWAHLDIAGPARAESDDGYITKGGTGMGVRTLVELLSSFEKPEPAA